MKSVFLRVQGIESVERGEEAMEEKGTADLSTLEGGREEARATWQAIHEEVEALLREAVLPEKQELRHLLAEEREAHRAYIEAIRAWAEAKSSA